MRTMGRGPIVSAVLLWLLLAMVTAGVASLCGCSDTQDDPPGGSPVARKPEPRTKHEPTPEPKPKSTPARRGGGASKASGAVAEHIRKLVDGALDDSARVAAARKLSKLGPRAKPAIPELIRVSLEKRTSGKVRAYAMAAAAIVDPADPRVVPAVIANLRDADATVRRGAAASAAAIGPPAAKAVGALGRLVHDQNERVRETALVALMKIGPAGIAGLVGALDSQHADVPKAAVMILSQMGPKALPALIKGLDHRNATVRHNAAMVLLARKPVPPEALGKIAKAVDLNDRDSSRAIIGLIGRMDPPPGELAQLLGKALAAADPTVRSLARQALSKMGPAGAAILAKADDLSDPKALLEVIDRMTRSGSYALDVLEKGATSTSQNVRFAAFRALARNDAPKVIPLLIRLLEHDQPVVRMQAVTCLKGKGPAAADAVGSLADLAVREGAAAKDIGRVNPRHCAGAVLAIDPKAVRAVAVWTKALADPRDKARATGAVALGTLGPPAGEAAAALGQAAADKDTIVRTFAVRALGQIGPAARKAAAALVQRLADETNANIRLDIARALGKVGPAETVVKPLARAAARRPGYGAPEVKSIALLDPAGKMAIPVWQAMVRDRDARIRSGAVRALAQFGATGADVMPAFKTIVRSTDPSLRAAAIGALGTLESQVEQILPILQRYVTDREAAVRNAVVNAAVRLGDNTKHKGVIGVLAKATTDRGALARTNAIKALGRMGPAAAAAIGALCKVQGDTDAGARAEAIRSLARIGPGKPEVVRHFTKALADTSLYVRQMAAVSLGKMGPAAKEALPALRRMEAQAVNAGEKRVASNAIRNITRGGS